MTTLITVKPTEKGTAVIEMAFTDEAVPPNAVTPTSLQWQLMKATGTIINSRTFALGSFTASAGAATVVLTGDDLAMFGTDDTGRRVFSIQGVYDSTAGTDLNITGEAVFFIEQLLGQTDD